MNITYKVGDLKRLISESSNEFKAVIGPNVEKENKSNNGKAYSDAKKRAKDFDGGLNKEVGEEKPKFEKVDDNLTTLDYEPANMTPDLKKKFQALANGYNSVAEKDNGLEKAAFFDNNEKIYQAIKKSGKEHHDNKKKMKKSGLQGKNWPDKVFDKEEMYESKDGLDMRKMLNRMNLIQEEFNGSVPEFYQEEDSVGKIGEPGQVKSYRTDMTVDNVRHEAEEEGMSLEEFLKSWWNEVSNEPMEFVWQKLGNGYGYHGNEILRIGSVVFKDIYGQLMIDEYEPGQLSYDDDFNDRLNNATGGNILMRESKNLKTVYFKKTQFLTEGHMLSRIPDEFKNEGEKFIMKDKTGNEYLIEWKNSAGRILEHSNKSGFDESINRIKRLYEYKSKDTETNNASRLNEDGNMFISTLDNARKIKN